MEELFEKTKKFVSENAANYTSDYSEYGLKEGTRLFDEPIFAVSDAHDEMYEELKLPSVIGEWHLSPCEWLTNAKRVVCVFFPYTKEVKESNIISSTPSLEWLYSRIEGQAFIYETVKFMLNELTLDGYEAMCPEFDSRFDISKAEPAPKTPFTSRFSLRHAAFISGMGTFGLSKGIITKKGICGRLACIITDKNFEVTKRDYTELYEYCIKCKACISRCPANAISLEKGKLHFPCSEYLNKTKQILPNHYGCGKCQTKVACMSSVPKMSLEKK